MSDKFPLEMACNPKEHKVINSCLTSHAMKRYGFV